ncbi:MAG: type II toxin-antitoxin system RelE/ParE family toxin [Stigonema ocellatum SAG 48.90 = DSM 106950]|nr:type II toxin-antitoxin system RelE/ParE family toxin [Stigonema ocellatum SAG 48.90 = DSM 106950]
MKQYTVIFSPWAEQHLGSLYAYIAEHGGEERAERYINTGLKIARDLPQAAAFRYRALFGII